MTRDEAAALVLDLVGDGYTAQAVNSGYYDSGVYVRRWTVEVMGRAIVTNGVKQ